MKKVRLHITVSPGAADRLRNQAAEEGLDVSGLVEILARSRRRQGVYQRPPLPLVPPEPEEEPDFLLAPDFGPPMLSMKPAPELRDPVADDAPETIRHLAGLVGHGITPAGKAALRAWMLGDDEALRLLGTPVAAEVREPFRLPVIIAEDQIPAMQAALQRVVDEATAAQAPATSAPDAPPKPLRDYSAPEAPEWVRRIVGALGDGLDALVTEEAMESLRAWRRGEDVEEPDVSDLPEVTP